MFKFNNSSGQASRVILVLGVIVLVAIIIVYLVVKMTTPPPAPPVKTANPIQQPVYEKQLGVINFIFESGLDRGTILKATDITNVLYKNYQQDFDISNSGAELIQVTVGAQNEGTQNTKGGAWDLGNIIDSQGRNFVPEGNGYVAPWLPESHCGDVLEPAFSPTPCAKIYEVSTQSTGLKVMVRASKDGMSAINSSNEQDFLLDLIVK